MSVYSTSGWQKIPERDNHGRPLNDRGPLEMSVDYMLDPGFVALRFDWEGIAGTDIHMTIDEARELIAGLERAINRQTEPTT
jgi:hypothetical protein